MQDIAIFACWYCDLVNSIVKLKSRFHVGDLLCYIFLDKITRLAPKRDREIFYSIIVLLSVLCRIRFQKICHFFFGLLFSVGFEVLIKYDTVILTTGKLHLQYQKSCLVGQHQGYHHNPPSRVFSKKQGGLVSYRNFCNFWFSEKISALRSNFL